jgi:hypothetical protein
MPIFTGRHEHYHWIACHTRDSYLSGVLQSCPAIVLGKTVAITSFDSGPLSPTEEERGEGWWSDGRIMYSPPITDPGSIPHEQYDEWLVFQSPPGSVHDVEVFINYGDFSFASRDQIHPWDPTWDRSILGHDRALRERFWSQLIRISPESYIAEGDAFLFASRNLSLTTCVQAALSGKGAT